MLYYITMYQFLFELNVQSSIGLTKLNQTLSANRWPRLYQTWNEELFHSELHPGGNSCYCVLNTVVEQERV